MFQKGQSGNPNGRPKGAKDRIAGELREAFAALLENNMEVYEEWLQRVAAKDPGKALELALKMSERFIPTLARQEMTGADGKDLNFEFKFGQKLDDNDTED